MPLRSVVRSGKERKVQLWEVFLTGLSLSADACAVAMCKGVEMKKFVWKYALVIAFCFGLFQALMPLIGWAVTSSFAQYITDFDHWIAFVLLAFLGIKMIADGIESEKERRAERSSAAVKSPLVEKYPPAVTLVPRRAQALRLGVKTLLVMSVATSIDALAVGVSFAFLSVNIWTAIALIGCTTFVISLLGVLVGTKAGEKFHGKAEIAGGLLLFAIGLKILLEHLGILVF